jgi:hypothetical protein
MIKFLFLQCLLLLSISCSGNSTGNDKDNCLKQGPDVLLPLTVGNYWNYQLQHSWTDSVEYVVSKMLKVQYEGEELNAHVWGKKDGDINWLYMNRDEGLYLVGGFTEYDTLIHPVLQYKYPVDKDETWLVPRMVYNIYENKFYFKDTLTYTCVDTNFMVTTDAGNFSTYVFLYKLKPAPDVLELERYYNYYSPTFGLILNNLTADYDSTRVKASMILYDYCLKP